MLTTATLIKEFSPFLKREESVTEPSLELHEFRKELAIKELYA
jgi:hypothetical protein